MGSNISVLFTKCEQDCREKTVKIKNKETHEK